MTLYSLIPVGFLMASAVLFYFAFKIGFDKTNKYGVQEHNSAGRALLSHFSQGALTLAAVILLLMAGCSVGIEPPPS
ncbi:MAG: hypothetical protein ACOY5F_16375 [Pseudomonadota bacterium]|jgi:hypothetical protein